MLVRDSQTQYIKPNPLKRQNDCIRNRMNTQRFKFFTVSTCRFGSRADVEKNIAENLAVSIIFINTQLSRAQNKITKNQHINSIPPSFFSWKKGGFFYSLPPSLSPSGASAFVETHCYASLQNNHPTVQTQCGDAMHCVSTKEKN